MGPLNAKFQFFRVLVKGNQPTPPTKLPMKKSKSLKCFFYVSVVIAIIDTTSCSQKITSVENIGGVVSLKNVDSSNFRLILDTLSDGTMKSIFMSGLGRRIFAKPQNWPNRRWSPLKYFGPIYGNSPDYYSRHCSCTTVSQNCRTSKFNSWKIQKQL